MAVFKEAPVDNMTSEEKVDLLLTTLQSPEVLTFGAAVIVTAAMLLLFRARQRPRRPRNHRVDEVLGYPRADRF